MQPDDDSETKQQSKW